MHTFNFERKLKSKSISKSCKLSGVIAFCMHYIEIAPVSKVIV